MSNIETIGSIYQAFGRGDVPAILERLAPDVDWEYGGNDEVPWLMPRRGRDGAGQFFRVLNELLEIRGFAVKHIVGAGNLVVGVVDLEAIVKPTGKPIREVDEAHLWHFDDNGRIARFRHRVDTQQHVLAYRG